MLSLNKEQENHAHKYTQKYADKQATLFCMVYFYLFVDVCSPTQSFFFSHIFLVKKFCSHQIFFFFLFRKGQDFKIHIKKKKGQIIGYSTDIIASPTYIKTNYSNNNI